MWTATNPNANAPRKRPGCEIPPSGHRHQAGQADRSTGQIHTQENDRNQIAEQPSRLRHTRVARKPESHCGQQATPGYYGGVDGEVRRQRRPADQHVDMNRGDPRQQGCAQRGHQSRQIEGDVALQAKPFIQLAAPYPPGHRTHAGGVPAVICSQTSAIQVKPPDHRPALSARTLKTPAFQALSHAHGCNTSPGGDSVEALPKPVQIAESAQR